MNGNQKKLQQMIKSQTFSLPDKDLFLSSAYQKYQTSMAKAATGRYRQGLQVLMEWDDSEECEVAYTDNYKIHVNAANTITQGLPSRILRSESLTGFTGHETGHLLYSDFTALSLYLTSMENGAFYPNEPAITEIAYQSSLDEIKEVMADKDKAACATLAKCAAYIDNILEDIYIEARMCETFPGTFKLGIQLNNMRMLEQMPSIQTQIDNGYLDFSIIANLILQYCRSGNINNVSGYHGEYLDVLEDCTPYIEESLYSDDSKDRFHATNHILVFLWKYIKPLVEDMRKKLQNQPSKDISGLLNNLLDNQLLGITPLPQGKSGQPPKQADKGKKEQKSNGLTVGSPSSRQEDLANTETVVQEEGNRIALSKTTAILDGNNPGITYNHQYAGSGYEKSASDLFRILNEVATEKANEQYEQDMTEELQKAANDIHYGNAHQGIHVTVNRITYVNDANIKAYQFVVEPLLRASKRLQKSIAPLLKEEVVSNKL